MGCLSSKSSTGKDEESSSVSVTKSDNGGPFSELSKDDFFKLLDSSGVIEDIQIVVAIDATASNDKTYSGGVNFHDISTNRMNVYEKVMSTAIKFFKRDRDATIPLYFYGSVEADESGGLFCGGEAKIHGNDCSDILKLYRESIRKQKFSGPTTFVPLFNTLVSQVKESKNYTVLLNITDGIVTADHDAHKVILKESSKYPLEIVTIGIGNADFSLMNTFDNLKGRTIDNFKFVEFNKIANFEAGSLMEDEFFYHAFMEVPKHYLQCKKKLGYEPGRANNIYRKATFTLDVDQPPMYAGKEL